MMSIEQIHNVAQLDKETLAVHGIFLERDATTRVLQGAKKLVPHWLNKQLVAEALAIVETHHLDRTGSDRFFWKFEERLTGAVITKHIDGHWLVHRFELVDHKDFLGTPMGKAEWVLKDEDTYFLKRAKDWNNKIANNEAQGRPINLETIASPYILALHLTIDCNLPGLGIVMESYDDAKFMSSFNDAYRRALLGFYGHRESA